MDKKIGIIVPYRNRIEHLTEFKKRISRYLKNNGILFELIIVEQDDAKLFNRGMLLNIGFKYAKELECNYVVFHDVDMIPYDVDYSYSDVPIHLANKLIDIDTEKESQIVFDEYFGGVTLFPIDDFEKINGYSNRYWGWGYEDTDLLYRCKVKGIKLDDLIIKNINPKGIKLKFNGINAYVKGKNFNNLLDFNSDLTLFVSFYPDELILNHEKESDDFIIFSIIGYDTSISYNSFLRYNFLTFDENNTSININSNITTNYKTSICVTFDSDKKKIEVYQDGISIGQYKHTGNIRNYILEQIFYIGCRINENGEQEKYFKGLFDSFAVYSKKLDLREIKYISKNEIESLTQNTDEYKSATKLKVYYNSDYIKNYELVDLSGNENNGVIVNCEMVTDVIDDIKIVKIPFRRNSTFYTLKHEENGFVDNKWKDQSTRWNQLRYHNEISTNPNLIDDDGLSNLEFIEHGKKYDKNKKILHLNVGI